MNRFVLCILLLAAWGVRLPDSVAEERAAAAAPARSPEGANAADPLGLGFVRVQMAAGVELRFYPAPDTTAPADTLRYVLDEQVHSLALDRATPSWFQPEAYKPDYQLLAFRCHARRDAAWYEVVVDARTGERRWLRGSAALVYEPWAVFLRNVFAVEVRGDAPVPIRAAPAQDAEIVVTDPHNCYTVLAVDGHWVQVTNRGDCALLFDIPEAAQFDAGWIRWRDETRLRVTWSFFA